ncbi:lipase family protein [Williamsia muralis]|uniref:lipase family protein n=1 Tax=Williamsia marianensis TaxID=85044 RepID=UPI003F15B6E4
MITRIVQTSTVGRRIMAFGVAILMALASTSLWGTARAGADAPPQQFYVPPPGFEDAEPGTVLRSRATSVALFGLPVPVGVTAWQLLYRTTDAQGSPSTTVTTVLAPPEGTSTQRLLSYQVFEDATAPQCAPSRNLSTDPDLDGVTAISAGLALVQAALYRGWTVSIPDHGGPMSEFGAAVEPGRAVLDGIRAARDFAPLGLPEWVRVGAAGYSGGALATGWAAEEHATYAPEIDLVGAAMGGTPVDLAASPYNLDGSAQAGTGLFLISGLRHTYPDLKARLDPYLTPLGRTTLDAMATACSTSNQLTNIARQYDTLFTEPFASVWGKPEIRAVLDQARLGTTATDVPRLLYHSVNDEAVPVTGLDRYVRAECERGARLTVRREELGLHLTTAVSGLALSMDWLDTLSDEPAPTQPYCDISTVPSFVGADPAATVQTVDETVRSLLGLPRR